MSLACKAVATLRPPVVTRCPVDPWLFTVDGVDFTVYSEAQKYAARVRAGVIFATPHVQCQQVTS